MNSNLKQLRLDKNLSIEEVSQDLKISKKYIIALERNDLSSIPGITYAKGYLKMYYEYLGIKNTKNNTSSITRSANFYYYKYRTTISYYSRISIIILLSIFIIYYSYFLYYSLYYTATYNNIILLFERSIINNFFFLKLIVLGFKLQKIYFSNKKNG